MSISYKYVARLGTHGTPPYTIYMNVHILSGEAGLKTMVMLCMEEKVDRGLGARPQENYAQPHPIDAWKRGVTPFLVQ